MKMTYKDFMNEIRKDEGLEKKDEFFADEIDDKGSFEWDRRCANFALGQSK